MQAGQFTKQATVRTHYVEYLGGEPTVLLLHGWTANAYAFNGLIQAGLSPRFRCLAIDLRGRGLSEQPADGYTLADHANDVIALMEELKVKSVVVVGHSYGGFVAMYLAALYPERFGRIVILEAARTIHPRNRELLEKAVGSLNEPIASWDVYLANLKQAPHFANWWNPLIEEYYRAGVRENVDGTLQARAASHVLAQSLSTLDQVDLCKILGKISKPILLLHANGPYGVPGTPPIVTDKMAEETAVCAPTMRIGVVPGNHLTMLYAENARVVVEQIIRFVNAGG